MILSPEIINWHFVNSLNSNLFEKKTSFIPYDWIFNWKCQFLIWLSYYTIVHIIDSYTMVSMEQY